MNGWYAVNIMTKEKKVQDGVGDITLDAAEEYIQGIYPEEEWEEMYKALEKRPYRYEKSTNEEFKDESNTEYIEIVEVELNTVNNSFNPVRV